MITIGFSSFGVSSNNVEAAYGKTGNFTVPKVYRGTWYTYGKYAPVKKVTFTKHTMNGKPIYIQNKNELSKFFSMTNKKAISIEEKATKNWYSGDYAHIQGYKFLRISLWITFETWNFYRAVPEIVNGKKQTVLWYTNFYNQYINYYRSKKIAKQMGNHRFPHEDRLAEAKR